MLVYVDKTVKVVEPGLARMPWIVCLNALDRVEANVLQQWWRSDGSFY